MTSHDHGPPEYQTPYLTGPKLTPFGIGRYGGPEGQEFCREISGDFSLHAAVRRKAQRWPTDAKYRVVRLDDDGQYIVIEDVHRIFHPLPTVRQAQPPR